MAFANDPVSESNLERMMPLAEVAPYFGRQYEWLLNRCKTGEFPHRKVGRNFFMTASDVRAAQESLAVGIREQRDPNGLRPRSRAYIEGSRRRGRS